MVTAPVCPLAALKAVTKSVLACAADASAICWLPLTVPGGKPVRDVPGDSPKSPLTIVAPVLVIVEPPSMAKLSAEPKLTADAAITDSEVLNINTAVSSSITNFFIFTSFS